MMNSNNVIIDKYKLWEGTHASQQESAYTFNSSLLKLISLDKYENLSSILEQEGPIPHLSINEITKKIIFDYDGDLYADIQQNLALNIYCWKECPRLGMEDFIMSEVANFRDLCHSYFLQMVSDVSDIELLPLSYKKKKKKRIINF